MSDIEVTDVGEFLANDGIEGDDLLTNHM